ncbi:hypothetical protein BFJ68_g17157 [Fusarium oxysporum]|uniref:Uncharacterized protein n=1 Tax=Fusarium oxysporum TaxID=5507 RepID=A0A420P1Q2_FUSOX|nr:hypothetical protein BFJ68_g17157 [Fusarium oxysporum]
MVLRNPQTRPSLGGLDQTKTKSDQTIPITGAFSGTWPGVSRQVASGTLHGGSSEDLSFDPVMITGFLIAGRGVGNIVSGPLSEALYKAVPTQNSNIWGLGGYGAIVVFTGITALGGGTSFIWKRLGWI